MKAVFLDFDGVLNSGAFFAELLAAGKDHGIMPLDPRAVARLNRLVAEAKADIVVSSSWRHGRKRRELYEILTAAGFVGRVCGTTPDFTYIPNDAVHDGGRPCIVTAKERGHEIQAWLDEAPRHGSTVESFVILDDSSDMAHLSDRLVQTQFADGLLDAHVDRALAMLRAPMPTIVLGATLPGG